MNKATVLPRVLLQSRVGKAARHIFLTAGAVLALGVAGLGTGTAQAQTLSASDITGQACITPGGPANWETGTSEGVVTSWLTTGADGQTYIDSQYPSGVVIAQLAVSCGPSLEYVPVPETEVQPQVVTVPEVITVPRDHHDDWHSHDDGGHHHHDHDQ